MLKKYKNAKEKQTAYRLRKRSATLDNPCGDILARAYQQRGLDVFKQLQLPALSFDEVCKLAGPWIVAKQFISELAISSPFIEVSRASGNPSVRLRTVPKKNTNEAMLAKFFALQDQYETALKEIIKLERENELAEVVA
jgi:hypothetical protein